MACSNFSYGCAYGGQNGPAVGKPMHVPVPAGTLKDYNDRYRNTVSGGYAGGNNLYPPPPSMSTPGYYTPPPVQPYYPSYSPPAYPPTFTPTSRYLPDSPYPVAPSAWFGSVNPGAPFPPVAPAWQPAGLLTREGQPESELLNLYRRPIAPLQEVWEYVAQDKNGFMINLAAQRYLNDGDLIHHVIGKGGPWRVHLSAGSKWVWV